MQRNTLEWPTACFPLAHTGVAASVAQSVSITPGCDLSLVDYVERLGPSRAFVLFGARYGQLGNEHTVGSARSFAHVLPAVQHLSAQLLLLSRIVPVLQPLPVHLIVQPTLSQLISPLQTLLPVQVTSHDDAAPHSSLPLQRLSPAQTIAHGKPAGHVADIPVTAIVHVPMTQVPPAVAHAT